MPQFRAIFRLLLALSACGIGGCYVPNGGWTLRSGFDLRTHKKPSCFTELVDSRWDEWNRVAQMNGPYGTNGPVVGSACPTDLNYSPPLTPIPEPTPTPAVNEVPMREPQALPASQGDPTAGQAVRSAAVPTGAWLFR